MNRSKLYRSVAVVVAAPALLSGCASMGDTSKTMIGCVGGTLLGSAIGYLKTGDARGILVGGVAGGMIGCGIGSYLDHREEKLKKLAEESALKPEFERIVMNDKTGTGFSKDASDDVIASQVSLAGVQPLFASGKAVIADRNKLKSLQYFLKGYVEDLAPGSKIYVVGHTDSSGSAAYNQQLSEKRARFIADQLVAVGADPDSLLYEGVGESQPIASNETELGKARNRRFELIDVFVSEKDKAKKLNEVSDQKVLQVASAKKSRIENVTNNLPTAQTTKTTKQSKPVTQLPEPKVALSRRSTDSLELGGVPLASFDADYVTAALGEAEQDYGFSIFSQAIADDAPLLGSCAYTTPVAQSSLKAYSGRTIAATEVKVADSPKNLYGTTWFGMADKTGVTLGPVGMREDTLAPTYTPILSFYKNYDGSALKPDYEYPVNVETYRGDNTVLVRMYAKDDNALMKCTDVVYSLDGATATKANAVIYQQDRDLMVKAFKLKLVQG
ncbi:OmpA family protein [Marinomonas fungiae]|uniref:Outer membrane protein OmpA and related peptidoglycan-associated (Lipo)proteins n=1 Tax=Marinomonas fungiae TaxID=1137284 RepID=A0A0K6IMA7_9GAMM|nr:OmpA family protein [Marinomonas fungiae]CUB04221.1 Outer membrane protein OmpA and related peptidoglycan-associated (lipo)proteins [Marinomonas fungiae]